MKKILLKWAHKILSKYGEDEQLMCKKIHLHGRTYIFAKYSESRFNGGPGELNITAYEESFFER